MQGGLRLGLGERSSVSAWWQAVVGGLDFHVTVQMHHTFSNIGSNGKVREEGAASAVFLRRTSLRPGVWLCHGHEYRPSVVPSDRGTLALLPSSRNASL